MDVQDHNLLVVSLDNSTGGNIAKTGGCIYTAAMSGAACNHQTSVVELTSPIQCLGTAVPRLQHQHLTQLQPIQYPQAVSYEPAQPLQQHTNLVTSHAIYQSMNPTPLHHYTPSQAILSSTAYLNTAPTPAQTIHLAAPPTISAPPIHHHPPTHVIQQHSIPEPQPVHIATEQPADSDITPEPTFPEDDFEYYKEIFNYLTANQFPEGVSENYKKHLRKRAQHYTIIDGKLYHSRKQPKEVIMKKEDQLKMLKDIHIIEETGVHLGVKKMFNKTQMKHFWRGMYIDVVTFVKNCEKCSDVVDMARQKQLCGEENEEDIEDPSAVLQNTVATQYPESLRVWKKVEVWMHGPLNQTCSHQEFLVTVVDEESRWVVACPVSYDSAAQIAEFLFHTFCSYGFAHCCLVGFTTEMKDHLNEELRWKVRNITDIRLSLVDKPAAKCQWVLKLVDNLVQTYTDWDQNLNQYLFRYRTGQLKAFNPPYGCTPFSSLFNHDPLGVVDNDDDFNKENIDDDCSVVSKKRKPQNNTLQCEYCHDVFTSKISFRIHQRRHLESRCNSGDLDESKSRFHRNGKKRIVRRGVLKMSATSVSGSSKSTVSDIDFKPPEACVESAVSAVKALLAATKEERRRRGKYHKYTPELQEHMAAYAVKHGNQQAVRYFSERLGTMVSESTIRNLVKVHSSFTPLLKDEIGRFAASFGVEPAARYFSDRLKRDIPQSLVRKFKGIHLEKLPDTIKRQKDKKPKDLKKKCVIKKNVDLNAGKAKRYSSKIKEEIGYYACQHSISDTVNHFSEKLQMVVKERTIRRFHKAYMEKYNLQSCSGGSQQQISANGRQHSVESVPVINMNSHHHSQSQSQPQPPPSIYATPFPQVATNTTTSCLPHPHPPPPPPPPPHPPLLRPHTAALPLYPLNQCSAENDCYQTPSSSSVIMAQTNGSFQYQSIGSVQNFQIPLPFNSHQTVPPLTNHEPQHQTVQPLSQHHEPQQDPSSFVMTQQPLIVSHEPNNLNVSTHFMVTPQLSTDMEMQQRSLQDKSIQKNVNDENNIQVFIAVKCDNDNDQPDFNNENYTSQSNVSTNTSSVEVSNVSPSQQKQNVKPTVSLDKKDTSEDDNEEEPLIKRLNETQIKKEKSKKEETSKKRGRYTSYSPELRAEIGKYAAEHSSLKACQYFSKLLGHDVPESTARGLKEKYLRKKVHCTVTSLGYSQRGRPLRLGKYDEVVQECLKELVRSGEKVSSFLAITTAKQILNKCEPELLEDNGGPIKLNTTWAKSFLKRIGVHNNS
ncbi:uncharacterized protein LOC142319548 [Lycorma delicatula]|uniref:uncharacterized protein LOC142319548 n=1 Tax=Lycorma delicatula TaxID=130591 RepID=UPI003F515658